MKKQTKQVVHNRYGSNELPSDEAGFGKALGNGGRNNGITKIPS